MQLIMLCNFEGLNLLAIKYIHIPQHKNSSPATPYDRNIYELI